MPISMDHAAGSFHTKKLCTRLYFIEVDFYQIIKNKKSLLEPPFGEFRGNVHPTNNSSLESP